jgi:uncharacterized protein (TIGR00725 family)
MAAVSRLPIVGVIGSGSESYMERTTALGSWLAMQRAHLLTGAGGGVMQAVSRAFAEVPNRQGLVLGIVPCKAEDSPHVAREGYPNEWVEIPIRTHLHLSGPHGEEPRSRNHLVVLTSALLIALPGGAGTASEVRLAIRYHKPLIAYLRARNEIPGLPAGVRAEAELESVKAFVAEQLARLR